MEFLESATSRAWGAFSRSTCLVTFRPARSPALVSSHAPRNRNRFGGATCVCLSWLQLGAIVEDHPDWPALLQEYKAALEHFERASTALTAALIDRDTDDLPPLFAAEASARDGVVLARMGITALWRESQLNLDVSSIPPNQDGTRA